MRTSVNRKTGLLHFDATAPNFYVCEVKIRNFAEICGEIARFCQIVKSDLDLVFMRVPSDGVRYGFSLASPQ